MANTKPHSPLVGYNTNVRHAGKLFHIQTEDSGVGHPHVITHLFTQGTILATKKTSYAHLLEEENLEAGIRLLMKDQHKGMFIELRDGVHDQITTEILGEPIGTGRIKEAPEPLPEQAAEQPTEETQTPVIEIEDGGVRVIHPSNVQENEKAAVEHEQPRNTPSGRSIFDTPDEEGDFGEEQITDKSLDEVILSYLTEELDE
ncbi:MAG: hypothetical protein GY847_26755 [Proteobacteria bacterium]|nr:hypothetical protein [Pseudomonadota bacterium]